MKYKYILFDLDGTITDPKIGITSSVKYALAKYKIKVESLDDLEKFIGPPLTNSFMEYYNFSEEEATQAIEYFREYFATKGIYENIPYEGIENLLSCLQKDGYTLAIATSKPTYFAKKILKHFKLDTYFELIAGSNMDNTGTDKAEIVLNVLNTLDISNRNEVIMIGDREHDIIGAKKNNIDSIGVLYGYGSQSEIEKVNPTYIMETVESLYEKLKLL